MQLISKSSHRDCRESDFTDNEVSRRSLLSYLFELLLIGPLVVLGLRVL